MPSSLPDTEHPCCGKYALCNTLDKKLIERFAQLRMPAIMAVFTMILGMIVTASVFANDDSVAFTYSSYEEDAYVNATTALKLIPEPGAHNSYLPDKVIRACIASYRSKHKSDTDSSAAAICPGLLGNTEHSNHASDTYLENSSLRVRRHFSAQPRSPPVFSPIIQNISHK